MIRLSERDESGCNHKDRINIFHLDYQQTALQNMQAWSIRRWFGGLFQYWLISSQKMKDTNCLPRWRLYGPVAECRFLHLPLSNCCGL
jgi:hypothetical protein